MILKQIIKKSLSLFVITYALSMVLTAVTTVTSKDELSSTLKKQGSAVVVKFYADWCGACKMMKPLDQEMESAFQGKVGFIHVDIDQAKDAAEEHTIQGVPTYIFYKKGKEVDRQTGAMDKATYQSKVKALVQ